MIELRKKLNVKVIAVVPCAMQEIKWKPEQKKRYKKILKKCDDVITPYDHYTPTCMNDRNKYMVDHSSYVLLAGMASQAEQEIPFALQNKTEIEFELSTQKILDSHYSSKTKKT